VRSALCFGAGVIFAVGLAISGMTLPQKVLNFLDFFGAWDPSLALVMVGAIGVHAVGYRVVVRRGSPLLAPDFSLPTRTTVDVRLLVGAVLFGVGWGLGGFCPGPAITSLVAGASQVFVFVAAMVAGMGVYAVWLGRGDDALTDA
jgi:hypothetical protein